VLLTVTTTHRPATDLGYLLHKHPDRVRSLEVAFGTAHAFFPEATEDRCTAALLLDVDPIGLVRGRKGRSSQEAFSLGQYVNDRPYAASSLLAVALKSLFATAMRGRSESHAALATAAIPLEIRLPALPCRGGGAVAERLFAPLGWTIATTPLPLDPAFPDWGDSRYVDLQLTGTVRLADALNQLYVLLPVLDDAKHYWVAPDEVDKLIRAGEGWLAAHPERALIARRYLRHRGHLAREAMTRLAEVDDTDAEAVDNVPESQSLLPPERQASLSEQRHGAVLAVLRACGARRVIDLGCGTGALLGVLLREPAFTEIVGVDVSYRALAEAADRLHLDTMPPRQRERITLLQSSATYRDARLQGYDAAVLMEVVEHVDPDRLPALERAVFGAAAPQTVVVTTRNVEYNVRYEGLPPGSLRHRDHRFEWTRAEFGARAGRVADTHGYAIRFLPVGEVDADLGPPTQLAVFSR
jgi:3' terminal RNA ribose 2'-O-methyltransferase Hen1